jgi:DNA-binding NarL/FixJ family response regulator
LTVVGREGYARWVARPKRTPSGVTAYRFDAPNEDLVVFVWPTEGEEKGARRPTSPLSRAEQEVLDLVLEGRSNAEIAAARRTSQRTVANQVAAILDKLGAASRFELIARGRR